MRFFFLLLLLAACNSSKKGFEINDTPPSAVLEMRKGICFGTCPVYIITVFDNGMMHYMGERYVDKLGLYQKQLSRTEYDQLIEAFDNADVWQYPDKYDSDIPDLPSTRISYFKKDSNKTILWKNKAAPPLRQLANKLQAYAEDPGWTPMKMEADSPTYNQLIVQLDKGVLMDLWVKQFESFDLRILKELTPDGMLYVISFDTARISPEEMLKKVKHADGVISAQYNRTIELRH